MRLRRRSRQRCRNRARPLRRSPAARNSRLRAPRMFPKTSRGSNPTRMRVLRRRTMLNLRPRHWKATASSSAARSRTSLRKFAPPDWRTVAPRCAQTQARAQTEALSVTPRHERHATIAGTKLFGCRREVQGRAASIRAATGHHQTMIADHKVAFADGGVVLDLERREAELVLAVAGAPGDDFLAIAIGIRQIRIRLAGFRRGAIDISAIHHPGIAGGAEAVARVGPALVIRPADREVTAVARADAVGLAEAIRSQA